MHSSSLKVVARLGAVSAWHSLVLLVRYCALRYHCLFGVVHLGLLLACKVWYCNGLRSVLL